MLTVIFAAGCAICAIGWFEEHVACAALIYYIIRKGYETPNSEEIEECTRFVVKKMFKL